MCVVLVLCCMLSICCVMVVVVCRVSTRLSANVSEDPASRMAALERTVRELKQELLMADTLRAASNSSNASNTSASNASAYAYGEPFTPEQLVRQSLISLISHSLTLCLSLLQATVNEHELMLCCVLCAVCSMRYHSA